MTYYLLFIFILDYRNDVKQKANSINFLSEVKMGHKAADTTRNINNVFVPGTANIQCSGCSRSFAKEKRGLKISIAASHQKLTTTS